MEWGNGGKGGDQDGAMVGLGRSGMGAMIGMGRSKVEP